MTVQTKYFSTISGGKIDRAAGVIAGVSVITVGPAKGHGMLIDSKTLETVLEVASEFSSGVKVKFRHKQNGEHQSVIDETGGVLKNFSIHSNKIRADFHLLKSLPADTKEKIFEMAEVMPDQFGFSIAFSGVSEEKDGKKFARCEELQSIDLSDNPAANPDGLFTMKDEECELCGKGCKGGHSMDELQSMYDADGDDDGDKKKKMKQYAEKHHGKKLSEKSKTKSMSAPTNEELALSISELTKLVKTLSENRHSATSLSIVGDDGKTVELSAKDIQATLNQSKTLADEAKKNSDLIARQGIIRQMDTEGRVPMNPATKKAYTLAELNALPIETLQFAAINSPVIPLEAKAVYHGESKPAIDPKLKGSERIQAAWSEKYSSLEQMLEQPITSTI